MALKTVAAPDLNDAPAAQALQQRHGNWSLRLPRQPDGLWDYLLDLDADSRAVLFAYCVDATINALSQSYNRRPRALAHADRLVTLTGLDMARRRRRRSTPTRAGHEGAEILDAVREAKGEASAQLIEHLKKGDMAQEAERLLGLVRGPQCPILWGRVLDARTIRLSRGRARPSTASRPPRRCLPASTRAYALPATSPCQARAWMQRWLWLHVSATQPRRRPTSRQAAGRHQGRRDRPSVNLRRSIED